MGDFAVTGAALVLRDSLALDIAGAVSGTAVTIRDSANGTALTVSGSVTSTGTTLLAVTDKAAGIALSGILTTGTLDMTAGSGGIAQTAGSITAATLQSTGGSAGTVALGETANSVAALGGFAVTGGDFTLIDSAALSVSGSLSAANVTLRGEAAATKAIDVSGSIKTGAGGTLTLAATNAAGGIALSGALDASVTGAVDLSAGTGGISQTGGGITAGSLRSTGGTTGAVALTQAANAIGRLDNFVVTGNSFALTDASALNVAGTVKATGIALVGSAAGTAITVNGTLDAGTGTLGLQASNAAGGLVLAGTVAGGAVDLIAGSGGIAQPGGSLAASTLTIAVAGGNAKLDQTTNSVVTLGNATITGGSLTLVDSSPLDVTGAVAADAITLIASVGLPSSLTINGSLTTTAGGVITLTASESSSQINLNGVINASATGIFDVSAGSHVAQFGGSVTAGTLRSAGGVGGELIMGTASNAIGRVTTLAVVGGATLASNIPLDIVGPLTASSITVTNTASGSNALSISGNASATGTMTLVSSDGIALSGTLNAATIDLTAGKSGIFQSAGSITAATLRGSSGSLVQLTKIANAITTLGDFSVPGGSFDLIQNAPLSVVGSIGANSVSIQSGAPGLNALQFSGTIAATSGVTLAAFNKTGRLALSGTVTTVGNLILTSGSGGISQTVGSLSAANLFGGAVGGDMVLSAPGNAIGNIFSVAVSGGSFTLVNSAGVIASQLSADNVSLRALNGTISTTFDGITAGPGGLIKLEAVGPGGAIQLGGFSLSNALNATPTGTIDLSAGTGGVQQPGGAIIAGKLFSSGGIAGAVDLTSTKNSVGSIGDIAVSGGTFTLANNLALTVTGTVSADNIVLTSLSGATAAINVPGTLRSGAAGLIVLNAPGAGGITLSGIVDATPSGLVDLTAGNGGITQSAGSITAGTLQSTGGSIGNVVLDQSGNSVTTLGKFAVSGGAFTLVDSTALTLAGPLSASNVTITDTAAATKAIDITGTATASGTMALIASNAAGGIALSGTASAATLDLTAGSAGITQTGGSITAGTLQSTGGSIGNVVLDQPSNSVTTLGSFAVSGGAFSLVDSTALTLAGPLSATNIVITDTASATKAIDVTGTATASGAMALTASNTTGGIALSGKASAATLDLVAGSGGIAQTTGSMTASGATTLATSGNINIAGFVSSGGTKATTLSAPNGAITIAAGAKVAAPGGLLQLTTSTGVTAPGALIAGKLAASASSTGNIALTGANTIATLVSANLADGRFSLNNAAPLAIAGPVTARLFGITAAGSITVADGVAFTTDGLDRGAQKIDAKLTDPQIAALTTSQLGSFLAIAGGGGPGKISTGNITVVPFSASKATIDFVLPQPDAGTISIGQLVGKATDLILVTRQNGIATGTVDIAGLLVLGGGGKVDLFGKIGGVDGQAAANKANISPLPNSDYRFNACPITSVNCVLLPVQTVPPLSPLRDVPIIRDRPTQDDADVQLPNVSDEDY